MSISKTPPPVHRGDPKPAAEHPGNLHNEREGNKADSQDVKRASVRKRPEVVRDEELKKTERNPESNPDYVKEQLRQTDA